MFNLKHLVLGHLLLFSLFTYGQESLTAVYAVKGIEDPNRASIDAMVLKQNSFFLTELAKQTFTLVAESKRSFFKIDGEPSADVRRSVGTWLGSGANGIWQDGESGYIVMPKNPIDEYDFIMQIPLIKDWTITQESKIIEGFRCYKAINSTKTVTPQGKEFVKVAIAWFCPEIPFSYGPTNYGGLPGLIVELQTESFLFGLKKLSLNSKAKVKPMPELEIVSAADHQKKFMEKVKSRKK